ncbi:uncharacterized protein EV420DRAFT_103933 [Desarmillaria tabescens]|uniref:Uncharacterized protein n=1 Tax=Armillaria tabescens TaxID=1929756 RepID=A0AA39TU80_ARMTA|nr:uncharacterized protein EV420DRAFT_103933 [Desarmillaria tabescens]KAK0470292.1 hypothetical protein EV420DRAFT_103933 [Desarmillaria tabescens]
MVARLRTAIHFAAILFSLQAAALPAFHIYLRDDDPSSTLPDPDQNQDIESVRDYMGKALQAYLATQNTQKNATFIAETAWRAIVIDTKGIEDSADSAGTDVMTGGDSAGDDVMTGNTKRDIDEDGSYGQEEWWKRYSDDDDELMGSALVGRQEDTELGDTGSEDTGSGDTESLDSSSGDSSSGSGESNSSSESSEDTAIALANNDVYHLFDKISWSKDDHINFFSDEYIQFTKEIGHIYSGKKATEAESKELKTLADLQSTLCTVQLSDVTDKAYYYYERMKKYTDEDAGSQSSQDFQTWVSTGYANYKMTYDQCQLALNKYNNLADKIFGNFRGPINAALRNIEPLDSGQVEVSGVNMMLGSGTGSLTGQGMSVPYYALPGAKGTVAAWRKQAQTEGEEESGGTLRKRKTETGGGKTDSDNGKTGAGDDKSGTGNDTTAGAGDGNTDTGGAAGGALGGVSGGGSGGDTGGTSGGDTGGDTGEGTGDESAGESTEDSGGDGGDASSGGSTDSSNGKATFKVPPGYFSYISSSKSGSVEGETDNGGGGVSFGFKDYASIGVGADSSKTSTSTELKMKSFSIAWKAALLPVQRGIWFDGYRVASLMSNLGQTGSGDDDNDKELDAEATKSFDKWFGTEDSPGPAAEYNDIALIIYRPIFTMEFSDTKTYQEFKETKASAGVCFFFICVGGNGGSSSNKTTFSETSSSVTYEDLSDNVYYAGSLKGSFWTQSGDSNSEETQVERRLLDWRYATPASW